MMVVCTRRVLENIPTYTCNTSTTFNLKICDRLCIYHPFTAFNPISFLTSFSSPIYGDYNGISLIFIRPTLQKLWAPKRNHYKIFCFEKSANFHTLQLLHTRSVNHVLVLTHAANATPEQSGDLPSWITRKYYSKKPSSLVKTRCNYENQAFLTMDCDRLQGWRSSSITIGE